MLGFLCGGETWTRVGPPIPSSPVNSMAKESAKESAAKAGTPKGPTPAAKTAGSGTATPAPAGQKHAALHPNDPVGDICLLPDIARFSH